MDSCRTGNWEFSLTLQECGVGCDELAGLYVEIMLAISFNVHGLTLYANLESCHSFQSAQQRDIGS